MPRVTDDDDVTNETELCTYSVDDGVCTLTFNRPDRMNGMTGDMELNYFENLLRAEADDDVSAIVLTGAGRGFCPGADLASARTPDGEPLPNSTISNTLPLTISKPMIAAINGACAGAGFGYALQCDVRFAVPGAKFTTAFARRGLIAEYGMAWLLPQLVGRATALDLLLSARVVLSEEMAELGVVQRIVEPDQLLETATAYARDLAANVSPASMATIKHQINVAPGQNVIDATLYSNALMTESIGQADSMEGILSFLEKRQADFAPLGSGTHFAWMDERPDLPPA